MICPIVLIWERIWGSTWSGKAIGFLERSELIFTVFSDMKDSGLKGTWKIGAMKGERPLVKIHSQLHGNCVIKGMGERS